MSEAKVYIYAKMYLGIQIQDNSNILALYERDTDDWSKNTVESLRETIQRHERDLEVINNWLENV